MNVLIAVGKDDNQEKFQKLVSFLEENEIEGQVVVNEPKPSVMRFDDLTNRDLYPHFTHKSKYHK